MIYMSKKALILFIMMAAFVVFLVAAVENNEGKPSKNTDGAIANCGINNDTCHEDHKDSSLGVYTTPDTEDSHKFAAPIEKDGNKLSSSDYDLQAKAVARGGKDPYINWLDDTDNAGQLDLTSADPEVEEDEEFWVGFGYKKDGSIFVFAKNNAYKYRKDNNPPVPRAKISVESDFPEDDEKTIEIEEGADGKTLIATLPKDGILPIHFSGEDSSDDDGDELTYYWDIDGDGRFEDMSSTSDDLNETGMTYLYNYTVEGTYELKFRVADGIAESDSIFFTLEVKETEKKPELYVDTVAVETEDGDPAVDADIYKGDELQISAFIRNHDKSGYGAATTEDIEVNIYYAVESEDYDTWHIFAEMPINIGKIAKEGQKQAEIDWDTSESEFSPDEYKIRVVVDEDDEQEEWDEENNEDEYEGIIDVQEFIPAAAPDLTMRDIEFSLSSIAVNDDVEIDVTIENIGEGDAENVFVKLYIDDTYKKASSSFTVVSGNTTKLSYTSKGVFVWSPSEEGTYDIKLELTYYHEGEEFKIELEEKDIQVDPTGSGGGGGGGGGTEEHDEDDGWFLDIAPVGFLVTALLVSFVLYSRKKR